MNTHFRCLPTAYHKNVLVFIDVLFLIWMTLYSFKVNMLTSVRIVVSYEGWYFSFSCGALFSIFSLSVFCFLSAPLGWKRSCGGHSGDTLASRVIKTNASTALQSSYLKDFDLAGGWVEMLCVLSTLVLFECVDLDAKRNTLFPSVLAHSKFCADAVNLKKKKEQI